MHKYLVSSRWQAGVTLGLMLVPALFLNGQEHPKAVVKKPVQKGTPAPRPDMETSKTTATPAKSATVQKSRAQDDEQAIPPDPAAPPAMTTQQAADDRAIRAIGLEFMTAYNAADAKAVAAHFAKDAEYVDEQGDVSQGRAEIETSLTEFFSENPGCQLVMIIDTLRFVSPGVAIEDGMSTVTRKDDPSPVETRYTTVHVKTDGKWLAASVRDHAPKDRRQHRAQLAQLDWLTGDWVDESDDALVVFSCKLTDHGNFLLRTFTIQIAGQESMSGTQRIGWDPLTGKLRMWMFDSEGGYGDGYWHRNDEGWVLKLTGVTADGDPTSSTSIYKAVNGHTMTWQSVELEIAGVPLPDSEPITIVRRAPLPNMPELTEVP